MGDNWGNIKMGIRLASDTDYDQIYAIYLEGIGNSFDVNPKELPEIERKFLSNFKNRKGSFNFWVAINEKNQIVGWQSLTKGSANPFRAKYFAESSTYISKHYRFEGVGELLLTHAIEEAKKSELHYITGFVSDNNVSSKNMTKKLGFIEVGVIPPSKKTDTKIQQIFIIRPL